jgi:SAM-dependent methyltransferase
MPDAHYEDPELVALYDLDSPWSQDRDFYLRVADREGMDILDLGCGTGLLCRAYAQQGHYVTGVDPSLAMLEVGRTKYPEGNIQWLCTTAQAFRSSKKYDLIIMTGHAFQVLQEETDVLQMLEGVKSHLKQDGRFVFESRNPNIRWQDRWNYHMAFETPFGPVTEDRLFLGYDGTYLDFELNYQFSDRRKKSRSRLRFYSLSTIKNMLNGSGLQIADLWGDWDQLPYQEVLSEEMIFSVTLG